MESGEVRTILPGDGNLLPIAYLPLALSKRNLPDSLMPAEEFILLSWIARNNDPYVRNQDDTFRRDARGELQIGPTMGLLFDPDSPYRGRVRHVFLLHTIGRGQERQRYEKRIARETVDAIAEVDASIGVDVGYWNGASPVDHQAIFAFLRRRVPDIRGKHPGRTLLINVSPGTPAMHTVWVLMAETGYIEPPFEVVQGIPANRRQAGEPAAVPVRVGIDTYYKAYRQTRPVHLGSLESDVVWDLSRARSDALRATRDEARRIAGLKVPVLISGERGTGKTTLARWIRAVSPFRNPELDAAWPAVSCGQFTAELMRSELFGHRKGAFTGAVESRDGLVKLVDRDTLFLDEIGDVSREVQRLLIRALEEKQYTPLGTTKPIHSDFRLITATNLDRETLSERLDPDFLDRISLFEMRMPPLREIRADLDWIWESVWRQAVVRSSVGEVTLRSRDHERIVEALSVHPLPANLRNLYRVAYYLLSGLTDAVTPMKLEAAVMYALTNGLEEPGPKRDPVDVPSGDEPVERTIFRSYLASRPLDPILDQLGLIPTKTVDDVLKDFLSREIRRIAKQRRVAPESITDVSRRTLLNWARD